MYAIELIHKIIRIKKKKVFILLKIEGEEFK